MSELRSPDPYQVLKNVPSFTLVSDDLEPGKTMPQTYVFDSWGQSGQNLSPHLRWSGFPAETQSFAVTCHDPDAPTGSGFWHWVLFDIPASVTELPRGAASGNLAGLPSGAIHARNDFGTKAYGGAAPPPGGGEHRYFFVVHALGVPSLGLDSDASPAAASFNCNANVLARGTLVVVYEAR
jgi:Raf kinase inhibitor-like YbhB/YbcL family protein